MAINRNASGCCCGGAQPTCDICTTYAPPTVSVVIPPAIDFAGTCFGDCPNVQGTFLAAFVSNCVWTSAWSAIAVNCPGEQFDELRLNVSINAAFAALQFEARLLGGTPFVTDPPMQVSLPASWAAGDCSTQEDLIQPAGFPNQPLAIAGCTWNAGTAFTVTPN